MGKTESLKLHNISIDATVCRFGVLWVESGLIFMQKIVVRLRLVSPFVHDEQQVLLLRVLPTCMHVELVPLSLPK
jgi:hypothetical protein